MVIDYASQKRPPKNPRNKLIILLILMASLTILTLSILLIVNQKQRNKLAPHPKNTGAPVPHKATVPQTHYEFYTLLPKLTTQNQDHD